MRPTQQASVRLAERTADQVDAWWQLVSEGRMSRTEFQARAVALVAAANTAGVQLADLGVTAEVARQLRRITRPLGMRPTAAQVDRSRIANDLDRIIARTDDPSGDIRVWVRSEPLLSVATAVTVAMVARGAKGWTRQLVGDNCPTCVEWADGVVRRPGTRMARHPGCDCIQSPVF